MASTDRHVHERRADLRVARLAEWERTKNVPIERPPLLVRLAFVLDLYVDPRWRRWVRRRIVSPAFLPMVLARQVVSLVLLEVVFRLAFRHFHPHLRLSAGGTRLGIVAIVLAVSASRGEQLRVRALRRYGLADPPLYRWRRRLEWSTASSYALGGSVVVVLAALVALLASLSQPTDARAALSDTPRPALDLPRYLVAPPASTGLRRLPNEGGRLGALDIGALARRASDPAELEDALRARRFRAAYVAGWRTRSGDAVVVTTLREFQSDRDAGSYFDFSKAAQEARRRGLLIETDIADAYGTQADDAGRRQRTITCLVGHVVASVEYAAPIALADLGFHTELARQQCRIVLPEA